MLEEYPKIHPIGHREIRDIFDGPVIIEEKIDGSQFSFGVVDGELFCKSRKKYIDIDNPDKLFVGAVTYVRSIKESLVDGWIYRGEVLQSPRHSVLEYDRIPNHHIVLFDVETDAGSLHHEGKSAVATILEIDIVPLLFEGVVNAMRIARCKLIEDLLEKESFLGGPKIEGVVVKNYSPNFRVGKYVSPKFKEVARPKHVGDRPTRADILDTIGFTYRTDARWTKAIQHLREDGKIQDDPRDIGIIIKEIQRDIDEECSTEIKELLWNHFKRGLNSQFIQGFPEWYKRRLFETPDE